MILRAFAASTSVSLAITDTRSLWLAIVVTTSDASFGRDSMLEGDEIKFNVYGRTENVLEFSAILRRDSHRDLG
jgi:hypothetical protein